MVNIDYIMDMLDWNNTPEVQEKGRCLAKEIKCINVFLQPRHPDYNKNVWDNCAIILSERTDEELSPYLIELLEWLQDLNWPGAMCILDRMNRYTRNKIFEFAFKECVNSAKVLGEEVWLENLLQIQKSV